MNRSVESAGAAAIRGGMTLLRRGAAVVARASSAAAHPLEALRAVVPQRLKRALPASVSASLLAHCGGTDFRVQRFAGNLLRSDLPEQDLLRIYHSLIFPNGVRKTSGRARNAKPVQMLLERARGPGSAVRILDIGSSLGVDALATLSALREQGFEVGEYVLGDLYPRILYDRERGLVFDEDGHLLQVRRRHSFVAVNFAYDHPLQRITHLPKQLLPWLLKRRYAFNPSARLTSIPLVHPALSLDAPGSPFRLRRMNVLEPLGERFDLIICMNLLLPRYFAAADIERGIRNLTAHLTDGGALIAGGSDSFRIVSRPRDAGVARRKCESWDFCAGCTRSGWREAAREGTSATGVCVEAVP